MNKITKVAIFGLASLVLTLGANAQGQGGRQDRPGNRQGNRQNMTIEEWREQQGKLIIQKTDRFMAEMGDAVPEEKKADLKLLVQQHLVEELKVRTALNAARQKAGGDRQAMRDMMMAGRGKMEDLTAATKKQAKGMLEKKAYQKFQKTLAKISPQPQRGQGGPGGGGRGGAGGGGGRGGAGGGGGGGGSGR